MSETPKHAVEATGTSLDILETLISTSEPLGVTTISEDVGVAKSVAHNHLSTLRAHGYAAKRGQKYEPSIRLLSLGERIRSHNPIFRTAKEAIDNLAAATGETTMLVVEQERRAVPIYIVRGDTDWTSPYHVGEPIPLHASAPGKCLTASLPDDELETIVDAYDCEPFTEATITDPAELKAELKRIRDDGITFCRGEYHEGMIGVAAPIRAPDYDRIAALGVCGHADRLNGRYLEEDVSGQVLSTSKAIQVDLAGE